MKEIINRRYLHMVTMELVKQYSGEMIQTHRHIHKHP